MKSRTNSSRRSRMWTLVAPVRSAFSRTGMSSSPWPRSAQNATTSQPYRSMSQRKMTEVSRPPEYASTTRFGSGVIHGASEEVEDDGLLSVQTVLGLIEHDAGLAVEHAVRDLFAPVRRQAVHDERARLGKAHHGLVDLVPLERLEALLALALLSHARPHVRVDHVGLGHRVPGVRRERDVAAEPPRRLHHARIRLVAGRAADRHARA